MSALPKATQAQPDECDAQRLCAADQGAAGAPPRVRSTGLVGVLVSLRGRAGSGSTDASEGSELCELSLTSTKARTGNTPAGRNDSQPRALQPSYTHLHNE